MSLHGSYGNGKPLNFARYPANSIVAALPGPYEKPEGKQLSQKIE